MYVDSDSQVSLYQTTIRAPRLQGLSVPLPVGRREMDGDGEWASCS